MLLCRYSSGMLGEESVVDDVDMADAEQQVVLLSHDSCSEPSLSPAIPEIKHSLLPCTSIVGQVLAVQRGGNKRKGKGKGVNPKAEANRELERQQVEMEDATIR